MLITDPFVSAGVSVTNPEENERSRLQGEAWFHGSISRQQAEALLKQVNSISC